MTSWYRPVDCRMWGDAKFRKFSRPPPGAQFLWLYLLTGRPTNGVPGLYSTSPQAIAAELGWSAKGTEKAMAEIEAQGMVKVDRETCVIFLPNALKYASPRSPDNIKSWAKELDRIPDCPLRQEFLDQLLEHAEARGDDFVSVVKFIRNQLDGVRQELAPDPRPDLRGGHGVGPRPDTPSTQYPVPKSSPSPPGGGDKKKPPDEAYDAARLLADLMRENDPKVKTPKDLAAWAAELDRLNRLDGRSWPEIESVLRWCQQDEFWCSNVLSARKLRNRFTQLLLKMKGDEATRSPQDHLPDLEEVKRREAEYRPQQS